MMKSEEIQNVIEKSLAELKDFQTATVNHIFQHLYSKEDNENRHLVAEEVGLGKTKVAKGLIAKALEKHLSENGKKEPFRAVYICSNQALVLKNLKDLNVLRDEEFINTNRSRLIFLALKHKENKIFQLSSLTPSTSFRLIRGTGIADERKLIWLILSKYEVYSRKRRRNGLKLVLKGNVKDENSKWWKQELDYYEINNRKIVRKEVYNPFRKAIANELVNLDDRYYQSISKELNLKGQRSLQEIIIKYSEKLRNDNVHKYHGQLRLLGLLRKLLTNICLDFLKADLFILDEFQRFKELLENDHEDPSEAAVIAKKVFNVEGAKVLMLSATPFKPYTTNIDETFKENHFHEFNLVLSFLFNHDGEKLKQYEKYRKEFFDVLRRPELIEDSGLKCKHQLEELYRNIISRTERILVSDDRNTLLQNKIIEDLKLKVEDILDFIYSDRIIKKVKEYSQKSYNIVDYAKSSPYPLSFMDKYKPKQDLKKYKDEISLKETIKKNKKAWIDYDRIEKYEPLDDVPNSRMRLLLEESVYNGMWKQLWLAPSLPYYELSASFENSHLNSKLLLFSKWKLVPRSVSTLVSYESERLAIANKKLRKDESITYTPKFYDGTKKRMPRKPTKLFALKLKGGKPQKMSTFTVLYPSLTLASLHNIQDNIRYDAQGKLSELKTNIKNKLIGLFEEANLKSYCKESRITTNWYWAAPILLDHFYNYKKLEEWLENRKYHDSILLSDRGQKSDNEEEEEEASPNATANAHFHEIYKVFQKPEEYGFGQFPDDLIEVLTSMVIASPSNCAIRTLNYYFADVNSSIILNKALDIATEFYALFDKPESISIVQLNTLEKAKKSKTSDTIYWNDVLNYCQDGNLQSVLDEFAHLIYFDNDDIDDFTNRLGGAINIRTTSIRADGVRKYHKVDEVFKEKKYYSLRSHYAVDFGSQNMEKEEGRLRVKGMLDNFNSPFRPFVLATTSIGQEGLDFHYYCRKVMHWNLPTNAIDLEQREGRVNRYKGLVIRQNIVSKYLNQIEDLNGDMWDLLFEIAEKTEGKNKGKPQLVPYWHVEGNGINIERIIPLLPFSKEVKQLKTLLSVLTLYRITFGQPRQEELIEILSKNLDKTQLEMVRNKLLIDLSPISYKRN